MLENDPYVVTLTLKIDIHFKNLKLHPSFVASFVLLPLPSYVVFLTTLVCLNVDLFIFEISKILAAATCTIVLQFIILMPQVMSIRDMLQNVKQYRSYSGEYSPWCELNKVGFHSWTS